MLTDAVITVIIPVHNRAHYVGHALDSIVRQTISNWQCVVVDDGSSDETPSIVKRYACTDNRITLLSLPENRGVGRALQAGLEVVRTPYFSTLDSDDWYANDTLEVTLHAFAHQPETTSVVCGNAVVWQENPTGRLVQVGREQGQAFTDQYDFIRFGPTLVPRVFRTNWVRQVGGFEADSLSNGRVLEDKLLLLKLIHVSNFAHVDRDLYHIRLHPSNMTTPASRSDFIAVKRYIYTRMLKEWGDEYEANFYLHPDGWLDVAELVPKHVPGR